MKIQVGNEQPREVEVIRFEEGNGLTLAASRDGGTADLIVSLEADVATADVTAVETSIVGISKCLVGTFTETAGAGTYTWTAIIPANSVILGVWFETTATWDSGPTVLDMGYTGSANAYATAENVDAVAGFALLDLVAGSPDYFPSGTTITAAITATGAGGTTGRTRVIVLYGEADVDAATKA